MTNNSNSEADYNVPSLIDDIENVCPTAAEVRLLTSIVSEVFTVLARRCILADDFRCCQSCAFEEIQAEVRRDKWKYAGGIAFYHDQDYYSAQENGCLNLSFGHIYDDSDRAWQDVGQEVVRALRRRKRLTVKWDETPYNKISVSLADIPSEKM